MLAARRPEDRGEGGQEEARVGGLRLRMGVGEAARTKPKDGTELRLGELGLGGGGEGGWDLGSSDPGGSDPGGWDSGNRIYGSVQAGVRGADTGAGPP